MVRDCYFFEGEIVACCFCGVVVSGAEHCAQAEACMSILVKCCFAPVGTSRETTSLVAWLSVQDSSAWSSTCIALGGNSRPVGNSCPVSMEGNSHPVSMGEQLSSQYGGNSRPVSMEGNSQPVSMEGNSRPVSMEGNSCPVNMEGNSRPVSMGKTAIQLV